MVEQLVIQIQSVRDLVGLDGSRLGLRGIFVSQVLEVLGDRTVVQVEVCKTIYDPGRDGRKRS